MAMRLPTIRCSSGLLLGIFAAGLFSATAPGFADEGESGTLLLTGDRQYEGVWFPRRIDGEILWRPDFLDAAVPFPADIARSITFPERNGVFSTGSCSVLFHDEDRISAEVVRIDEETVQLESALLGGLIDLPRSVVRRIEWREAAPGYLGPGRPDEWGVLDAGSSTGEWTIGTGGLSTSTPGAELWKDLGLRAPSKISMRLIGTGADAGFRIVLGAPGIIPLLSDGLFIETWGDRIVVYRELDATIEFQVIERFRVRADITVEWDPRLRLCRFVDEEKTLATVALGEHVGDGLYIQNLGEGLIFPRVEITRLAGLDGPEIHATGELDGNDVVGLEDGVVRTRDGANVPLTEVAGITFPARAVERDPTRDGQGSREGTPVRFTFRDSSELHARFRRFSERGIEANLENGGGEVVITPSDLQRIEFMGESSERPRPARHRLIGAGPPRVGTCHGFDPKSGDLLWSPDGSERSAPFAGDFDGTVVFAQESEYFIGRIRAPHDLHLRDGDRIPVAIARIDDETLRAVSPFGGEFEIPANEVRALELDPRSLARVLPEPKIPDERPSRVRRGRMIIRGESGVPTRGKDEIDEERRARILSLPRVQLQRPPSHLLIGRNGDLLRGNLLAIDDTSIRFEVHLRELSISVEDVAGVIRLDPPAVAGAETATGDRGEEVPLAEDPFASAKTVQLVLNDRMRVRARVERWDADGIVATTRWLGRIEVKIADLEQIVIGESARSRLSARFHGWQLKAMPEPADPPPPVAPGGG